MAQEKTIQLSDSAIQTVTQLETNDRLLVSDSSGGMKRIAPRDVNKVNIHSIAIPSEGWARIAELKVCESGLISIYSAWSENNPPRTILLAYSIGAYYSSYHKIVQVCGTASKIKKVRLVSKNASNLDSVFLEIYVDHGVTVYTTCITPSNAVVFSSYQAGNVPAGYVSNEITIVNSSQFGGGKLQIYKELQNLAFAMAPKVASAKRSRRRPLTQRSRILSNLILN